MAQSIFDKVRIQAEEHPDEFPYIYFQFRRSHDGGEVSIPEQPYICNGVVDTSAVDEIVDAYMESGVEDESVQIIFSLKNPAYVKFWFETYDPYNRRCVEILSYGAALARLDKMLQNGGRPYDVFGHYF